MKNASVFIPLLVIFLIQGMATHDVNITIEVDVLEDGEWCPYNVLNMQNNGYLYHIFPDGFSAHWVRLKAYDTTVITAVSL